MEAFLPGLRKGLRFIYVEPFALTHVASIREVIAKDDGMIVGSLDWPADRAVFDFVPGARGSIFAGSVITERSDFFT